MKNKLIELLDMDFGYADKMHAFKMQGCTLFD